VTVKRLTETANRAVSFKTLLHCLNTIWLAMDYMLVHFCIKFPALNVCYAEPDVTDADFFSSSLLSLQALDGP